MRMQSSHVEDYEGDEEEGFAWMHLKSNEQLLALAFDIKTRMRLNINNQSLNNMLTTLRSCSAMIILAPLVASNFLLLFLSPFSPPNTAKETTRKKCHLSATFLCRHLRVTEGLQIRRLHNHEVQIRTSRNSSTRRPIRHTHTLDPSRFNFTAPSHHFYRYRRPLATCYNQRAEATAIILTAMHVHTSNCLLD